MKKFWILLFGCFILGALPTLAQKKHYTIIEEIKPIKTPRTKLVTEPIKLGYQSHIELGMTWFWPEKCGTIDVQYIGGWRFNNRIFLGAGLGFLIPIAVNGDLQIGHYGNKLIGWDDPTIGDKINVPLFLHARYYFVRSNPSPAQTRFMPFVSFSLGGVFGSKNTLEYTDHTKSSSPRYNEKYRTGGFFINPALGMNFRVNNRSNVTLHIGYWGQQRPVSWWGDLKGNYGVERDWTNNINVRIGYSF